MGKRAEGLEEVGANFLGFVYFFWGNPPPKKVGKRALLGDLAVNFPWGKKEAASDIFGWLTLKGNPSQKKRTKGTTGQLVLSREREVERPREKPSNWWFSFMGTNGFIPSFPEHRQDSGKHGSRIFHVLAGVAAALVTLGRGGLF